MISPRYVYAIINNRTGKVYIGSTKNPKTRYQNHLVLLRNHKHPVEDFQDDFDKFGEDLTFIILDEFCNYTEKDKEYEWMKRYRSYIRGQGYNYKDRYNFGGKPPEKRSVLVTENERELIKLIRESEDPAAALQTAVSVVAKFLEGEHHEFE